MSKKVDAHVSVEAMDESKIGTDSASIVSHFSEKNTEIKRGLKSRHIQLIGLGGAIGTGLFVGSGGALSTCGPGGILIGYVSLSFFVWLVMNQLAEIATLIPLAGESTLYAMSRKYVSRSFSFTCGWNIFYAQAMIPPSEITACAFVIKYWSDANPAIWITIFLVVTIFLNVLPVSYFGESEFYVAIIKILCITGLIILGIVIFFGGGPNQHGVLGFKYWNHPGAFTEHLVGGNTGKFLACWTGIIKAGFSFILTPELIVSCTSEAQYPRRNLPIVCKRFVYRLAVFYILGSLVIGVVVAYNDPRLMGAINSGQSSAAASPFVIGMTNVGIHTLPHIVNACILTSAYSAGTSLLYGASRSLHSMALQGDAPKIFSVTTSRGVPLYAVGVSSLFLFLAYLNCSKSATTVFNWFTNIATIAGFISWSFVGITYIFYRKVIDFHKLNDRVPFRPPMQRVGAYMSVTFFSLLSLTNGYAVFIKGNWNTSDFFTAYITLIIIFVLYVGNILWRREWKQLSIPVEQIHIEDLISIAEEDEINHAQTFDEKYNSRKGVWWKVFYAIL
ncbi:putative proline-specific permease [Clavispora lusitaniae]|uniref:Amino acid permease/ SLC12A domain-containing protein n=3 Tax=Clavispora lusitaniae TaxID=36911 RepID=C4Y0E1_CLAL4|nr:uncharacterized protein CLUG_01673 [Clavispora lusitaniae ATCC 42720]KAF5212087.1 hypothetical protein E0198_001643 [Clavispora lusitaniae]EEQ37550.1 hypothetical protein CLUG_01673 [Clavispora lusitaniae ATCC 42720]KAF7583490.1 Amino acid permease family protein [Clavispora lusitaniae]OVF07414.1 putative proline-specific permease [Clavispora lusitaniae]QFZ26553.1 putative proline-specific permease [Clavispora lusitaniae]